MKKSEINVDGHYYAKVSGNVVVVRVNEIEKVAGNNYRKGFTAYHVTNLKTDRQLTFKSAAKFREEAIAPKSNQKTIASYPGGPRRSIKPLTGSEKRRIEQIEAKYSTEKGATEAERQEAQDILTKPTTASLEQTEDKVRERIKEKPDSAAAIVQSMRGETTEAPHIVVKAYAGTGKTFSQIVGIAYAFIRHRWDDVVKGMGFDPTPSDEQRAIWEGFAQSKGVRTITYCAFNKSIVNEFSETWGWLVELLAEEGITLRFATVNSLGYRVCSQAYGKVKVNKFRVEGIITELLGFKDNWELKRKRPELLKATEALVDKCKLTLAGWLPYGGFDPDSITHQDLDDLASHFDIEMDGERGQVYELVPLILEECQKSTEIDFNDQNWLPIVNNLSIPKQDLLLIDESQDLPRCKQEFCLRMARRMVLVGDIHQAIYGFAGADTESIPRMIAALENTPAGCEVLQLTETRRCGKVIVKEAQKYVPDFCAHDSNSEGEVKSTTTKKYHTLVQDGDMVLSRVNAPLVSQALQFIKQGRKAIVRGRDFGAQLTSFIGKLEAETLPDMLASAGEWLANETLKENSKKNPSDTRIQSLQDRYDVVCVFAEDAATIDEVLSRIELVFAGKVCPTCGKHYSEDTETCPARNCKTETGPTGYPIGPRLTTPEGILFSSIHRAKGLESANVFLLCGEDAPIPHPMAKTPWQRTQEYNLLYIAITRAINTFTYVS